MRRVLLTALFCAAFFAALYRPAFALAEFCPASLQIQPVGSADDWRIGDSAAALYGFELLALGTRTASGVIAFDTDSGWYTATVPPVGLFAKLRHYTTPTTKYAERDFVSTRMYVRFPTAVTVMNAWMYHALAIEDGAFGWQAIGELECPPPAGARKKRPPLLHHAYTPQMDPNDGDHLSAAPADRAVILEAKTSSALLKANCSEPDVDASATKAVTPSWPFHGRIPLDEATTAIRVAINADGSLADAWLSQPSGYREADDAALEAARRSTYQPARSYCRSVPGQYLFRVTFDPN